MFRGWINQLLRAKVVNLGGVRVHAGANARSQLGPTIWHRLMRGGYEYEERQLLMAIPQPGDRLPEIGACLGVMGILAARLIGEENVTSQEANPVLERYIRAKHELNGLFLKLIAKAVTSEGGTTEFHFTDNVDGSSIQEFNGSRKTRVESESINKAIAEHDPSVLVIDAEGSEIQLLPQAEFHSIRAVLVEFHSWFIGEEGIKAIETALANNGLVRVMELGNDAVFERNAT